MPYYLHPQNDPPESGTPYPNKRNAVSNRCPGQTITFLCDDYERETWQARERRRFYDKLYTPLPWLDDDGFPQKRYRTPANSGRGYGDESPFAEYVDYLRDYFNASQSHFAHVSLQSDAMIAYTPSDEHGHADRQVRIRCGRYLDLVAPFLQQHDKDKLCATIRAMTSATFKLATSASDIRAVYRYGHGFESCMDGRNFGSDDDLNPVSVYGASDLAVAYLGTIDGDDKRITARCVVWPEKKIYTRIYGDELLACLLKAAGWTDPGWEESFPLTGARIRAIAVPGYTRRWVMPYLDAASTVSLTHDRQHFILCDEDDPGEFSARETNGRCGSRTRHCANCGDRFTPEEDESECSACHSANDWQCYGCDENFSEDEIHYTHAYRWYCETCETAWQAEHNPLSAPTVIKAVECYGHDRGLFATGDRIIVREIGDCSTVYGERDCAFNVNLPTSDIHILPSAFAIGQVYEVIEKHDRFIWIRRIVQAPFHQIPIGMNIRVIEIPHHIGTKISDTEIRWHPCPRPGNGLCHCSPSHSATYAICPGIPADKLYEVIA